MTIDPNKKPTPIRQTTVDDTVRLSIKPVIAADRTIADRLVALAQTLYATVGVKVKFEPSTESVIVARFARPLTADERGKVETHLGEQGIFEAPF